MVGAATYSHAQGPSQARQYTSGQQRGPETLSRKDLGLVLDCAAAYPRLRTWPMLSGGAMGTPWKAASWAAASQAGRARTPARAPVASRLPTSSIAMFTCKAGRQDSRGQ